MERQNYFRILLNYRTKKIKDISPSMDYVHSIQKTADYHQLNKIPFSLQKRTKLLTKQE